MPIGLKYPMVRESEGAMENEHDKLQRIMHENEKICKALADMAEENAELRAENMLLRELLSEYKENSHE